MNLRKREKKTFRGQLILIYDIFRFQKKEEERETDRYREKSILCTQRTCLSLYKPKIQKLLINFNDFLDFGNKHTSIIDSLFNSCFNADHKLDKPNGCIKSNHRRFFSRNNFLI